MLLPPKERLILTSFPCMIIAMLFLPYYALSLTPIAYSPTITEGALSGSASVFALVSLGTQSGYFHLALLIMPISAIMTIRRGGMKAKLRGNKVYGDLLSAFVSGLLIMTAFYLWYRRMMANAHADSESADILEFALYPSVGMIVTAALYLAGIGYTIWRILRLKKAQNPQPVTPLSQSTDKE
jgi:hypothetical protein